MPSLQVSVRPVLSPASLASRIRSETSDRELITDTGLTVRLPTGEDELAVLALPPEVALNTLLKRCAQSTSRSPQTFTQHDIEEIDTLLKSVAPLISGNLTAVCPNADMSRNFT
jgi:hypothetical protein